MPDKILVVDDDIETLRLVGLMLQRQGFQIVAASNGNQALTQASHERPDLILLDVMMPDMDGYQVTRQLRKDPATAYTPILMFTAKSQVDDKVAGYEAGVDDYLTKPVHPVELVARIKALLARNRGRVPGFALPSERGYVLGVMAPRGGMGSSSLVLNLSIAIYQQKKMDLIAAELRPGNGTWAQDLGIQTSGGLSPLLHMKPTDINPTAIDKELMRTTFGPRLLVSSNSFKDLELMNASVQTEALVQQMSVMAPMLILDIGAPIIPSFDKICAQLQEAIVITEPYPGAVSRTRRFLDELGERGFGRARLITVVIINRVRADVQLSVTQVQDRLGYPVTQVFPPAAEQAYQAGLRNVPLIQVQPDSLLAQQYSRLAEHVMQRVQK
jgi:DNA-binding response OmpR family regulator